MKMMISAQAAMDEVIRRPIGQYFIVIIDS